jgi:hypothetical protein
MGAILASGLFRILETKNDLIRDDSTDSLRLVLYVNEKTSEKDFINQLKSDGYHVIYESQDYNLVLLKASIKSAKKLFKNDDISYIDFSSKTNMKQRIPKLFHY